MRKCGIALVVLAVVGVCLVAAGVGLIYYFPQLIRQEVDESVVLTNGSDGYKAWVSSPVPIYLQVTLFHVVNKDEVLYNGSKPIVVEKGPYVYLENKMKDDITFEDNATTIRYFDHKAYTFMPNMSKGSENDTVTIVNFPILSLATEARFVKTTGFVTGLKFLLWSNREGLFMTRNVKDILFGYNDPVFRVINSFLKTFPSLKKYIPGGGLLPDKVGLLINDKGSNYTIKSGKGDIDKINNVIAWNDQSVLPFWNSQYANMINGTDGTSWHPFVDKEETLFLFSGDVCRSIYARYEDTVEMDGISLYQFVLPPTVLANATVNPENKAFCTPNCLGTGVLNISVCQQGAPLVMSMPHFYQADEKYVNAIGGMHPDKKKHETVLNVEPITGAVLNAAKRLQFNIYIHNLPVMSDTSKVADTIFPLMWVIESGEMTPELASEFKDRVYTNIKITKGVQWGLISLGGLLVLIVILVAVVRKCRETGSPLSVQADDTIGILQS